VLITGAVATTAGLVVAVPRLHDDRIPQAALLAAALFVASLVSVPAGPVSVHLLLNGVMGLVLGWAALPAVVVALVMQMAFFGFGGVLSLGVNAFNIGAPALLCGLLLRPWLRAAGARGAVAIGAVAGFVGVAGTAVLLGLSLTLSGEGFGPAARVIALAYLPLAAVEAVVSGAAIGFVRRVSPELLLGEEVR